jgi:hypothetical protein
MIKLVYVAGPFSAKTREGVEANILAAAKLGVEVAKLGACPWVPHANTALPEYEHVQPYRFWIDATERQRQLCDAMIMLPNWRASSGAREEHAAAVAQGQPIFYDLESLATWLRANQESEQST